MFTTARVAQGCAEGDVGRGARSVMGRVTVFISARRHHVDSHTVHRATLKRDQRTVPGALHIRHGLTNTAVSDLNNAS